MSELLEKAKAVLQKNDRGTYTLPSVRVYPHQWSWDSAFIAIGLARYDTERAQQELESVFEGQWEKGMIPHIVFRSNGEYFPNAEYWGTEGKSDVPSSGITQPCMHAIAAWKIHEYADGGAEGFLERIYPKLLAFHRWLSEARDPEDSGLITILHPWESGLDNSPRWDEALSRITPTDLPAYERVDDKQVDPRYVPTDDDYDRYFYLMQVMKRLEYDDGRMDEEVPFRVKDMLFTAIWYLANMHLQRMAELLGEPTDEIERWIAQTREGFYQHCEAPDEKGLVYDYDLPAEQLIEVRSVASLSGLMTDIPTGEQMRNLYRWITKTYMCTDNCVHEHYVVSSYALDDEHFDPHNYWRGPIWINMNWLLYEGLKLHGMDEDAATLRDEICRLVDEHGCWEYYHPLTGEGIGSDDFSWTAALVIDLLSDTKSP